MKLEGCAFGFVPGLLGVVFVTLKLLGLVDWSWWWVTAPFWGGAAGVIIGVAAIAVIAAIEGEA